MQKILLVQTYKCVPFYLSPPPLVKTKLAWVFVFSQVNRQHTWNCPHEPVKFWLRQFTSLVTKKWKVSDEDLTCRNIADWTIAHEMKSKVNIYYLALIQLFKNCKASVLLKRNATLPSEAKSQSMAMKVHGTSLEAVSCSLETLLVFNARHCKRNSRFQS